MSNPEQTEEIVLSGYNTITWKDERLKWDTAKYDGYGVYQHMGALIGWFSSTNTKAPCSYLMNIA